MRSLFIKLFLAVWVIMNLTVAIGIVLAVTSTTGPVARHRREVLERKEAMACQALSLYGPAALQIAEGQGSDEAQVFVERIRREQGVSAWIFDQEGRLVLGNAASPEVLGLISRLGPASPRVSQENEANLEAACRVQGPDGRIFLVAGAFPDDRPPRPDKHYPFPPDLWKRLVISFVLCAVLCFLLARNLTTPVKKLRAATRQVAEGNLSVRVSPGLGKRRDELAGLAADFDFMAERVENLLAAKKRLLRDISHELRSPLARLNVALELARQHAGDKAGTYLDKIGVESERLNELIGQLRTLTMMESRTGKVRPEAVDLAPMLRKICEDAGFESAKKGVRVMLACPESVEVSGYPELLHRVFENIVRNAILYTAEKTQVFVDVTASAGPDGRVRVRVRDQGPGAPESELDNLTTPFYRLGEDRDRKTGGAGVGLAIVLRAVHLHGGALSINNAPEGGLAVEVQLPAGAPSM